MAWEPALAPALCFGCKQAQGQSVPGQRGAETKEAADCSMAHGLLRTSSTGDERHDAHERTFLSCYFVELTSLGRSRGGLMECQHHQSAGSQVCVWSSNKAAGQRPKPLSHSGTGPGNKLLLVFTFDPHSRPFCKP